MPSPTMSWSRATHRTIRSMPNTHGRWTAVPGVRIRPISQGRPTLPTPPRPMGPSCAYPQSPPRRTPAVKIWRLVGLGGRSRRRSRSGTCAGIPTTLRRSDSSFGQWLSLGVLFDHPTNVLLALDLALLGGLDDFFVLFLGDDGNLLTVAVDDLAVLDRVTLGEDGLTVDEALQLFLADDSAGARDEDRAIRPILRPRTDVVEEEIEQHGHDRGRGDPGVEDDADPRGEGLVEVGLDDRDDTEGQRDRDDDHVEVALVLDLRQGADAGCGDRAEEHDARTAEHRHGNGGYDSAHDRQQTEDDEDHTAGGDDEARLHTGDRHQADVLSE